MKIRRDMGRPYSNRQPQGGQANNAKAPGTHAPPGLGRAYSKGPYRLPVPAARFTRPHTPSNASVPSPAFAAVGSGIADAGPTANSSNPASDAVVTPNVAKNTTYEFVLAAKFAAGMSIITS